MDDRYANDDDTMGEDDTLGPVDHSTQEPDLARSVMRTVVSNGSDALNLLFQAAGQDQNDSSRGSPTRHVNFEQRPNTTTPRTTALGGIMDQVSTDPAASETYKLWKSSRFVKLGWLSAGEVITYLDL